MKSYIASIQTCARNFTNAISKRFRKDGEKKTKVTTEIAKRDADGKPIEATINGSE